MSIYRESAPTTPALRCPRDGAPLERRRIDGLDLHHCERCRGVWLGAGEFGRMLTDPRLHESVSDDALADPRGERSATDESPPVRCPVCHETCRRHEYGGRAGSVLVDSCKDGIWLDAGELRAILDHTRADARRRLRHVPRVWPDKPPRVREPARSDDDDSDFLPAVLYVLGVIVLKLLA